MPKVLIETYGCTLNQADSDIMEDRLRQSNVEVERGTYNPSNSSEYDFVIVNTCTVKKATEQRISDRLGKMRGLGKRLVVTGCMASANPDIIEKVVEEASILSTNNISRISEALREIGNGNRIVYNEARRDDKANYIPLSKSVIARIPVSEGCLSSCSFCETKFARGPLNSFSEELILRAIEMNVRNGAKEIELTSQDMGAYGADKKTNIARLLLKASEIEGEFMLRVGMLNPEHLPKYFDELVDAYKSDKIYKFVHLPVQSGSNIVLEKMGRHYEIEEFVGYVHELRQKVPDISVETDIIVGYPTETEENFKETVEMVKSLKPTVTNISKFGARPHAESSKMRQLRGSIIKERSLRLSKIVKLMQHEEFSKPDGEKLRVLLTEKNDRSLTGRDRSYRAIAVNGIPYERIGSYVDVRIIGNSYACLIGSRVL